MGGATNQHTIQTLRERGLVKNPLNIEIKYNCYPGLYYARSVSRDGFVRRVRELHVISPRCLQAPGTILVLRPGIAPIGRGGSHQPPRGTLRITRFMNIPLHSGGSRLVQLTASSSPGQLLVSLSMGDDHCIESFPDLEPAAER